MKKKVQIHVSHAEGEEDNKQAEEVDDPGTALRRRMKKSASMFNINVKRTKEQLLVRSKTKKLGGIIEVIKNGFN